MKIITCDYCGVNYAPSSSIVVTGLDNNKPDLFVNWECDDDVDICKKCLVEYSILNIFSNENYSKEIIKWAKNLKDIGQ